eukprot:1778041-Rhodomonas_salina.1
MASTTASGIRWYTCSRTGVSVLTSKGRRGRGVLRATREQRPTQPPPTQTGPAYTADAESQRRARAGRLAGAARRRKRRARTEPSG